MTLHMGITIWSIQKIRLIIFLASGDEETPKSQQKTISGADCDSGHQVLFAKLRLKLKKVDETTRPFRYDLNHSLMIMQWR